MIKMPTARYLIEKLVFNPENPQPNNSCHLEPASKGRYLVVEDRHKIPLCYGKELKGYIGDILYLQYDGQEYGTGDFVLKSDRHGMVCKFKERTEAK